MIFKIQNRLQYIEVTQTSLSLSTGCLALRLFQQKYIYILKIFNSIILHNPIITLFTIQSTAHCTVSGISPLFTVTPALCPLCPGVTPSSVYRKNFLQFAPLVQPGWCWQCWHIWDARALSLASQGQATYTGKYDSGINVMRWNECYKEIHKPILHLKVFQSCIKTHAKSDILLLTF